jgi:hypothetical protein
MCKKTDAQTIALEQSMAITRSSEMGLAAHGAADVAATVEAGTALAMHTEGSNKRTNTKAWRFSLHQKFTRHWWRCTACGARVLLRASLGDSNADGANPT